MSFNKQIRILAWGLPLSASAAALRTGVAGAALRPSLQSEQARADGMMCHRFCSCFSDGSLRVPLSNCAPAPTALMGRSSLPPSHDLATAWEGCLARIGGLQAFTPFWAPPRHVFQKLVVSSGVGCEQRLDTDKMVFLNRRMCYPGGRTSIQFAARVR